MTVRLYDVLETTLQDIDRWREDSQAGKGDVLDSFRDRILMLMTQVLSTPLIGSAYSYPGDLDLREWAAS